MVDNVPNASFARAKILLSFFLSLLFSQKNFVRDFYAAASVIRPVRKPSSTLAATGTIFGACLDRLSREGPIFVSEFNMHQDSAATK